MIEVRRAFTFLVAAFMALTFLSLVSGCVSQDPGTSPAGATPTPGEQVYTNSADGFRISVPYDWTARTVDTRSATFIPEDLTSCALPSVAYLAGGDTGYSPEITVIWGLNLTNCGTEPDLASFQETYLSRAIRLLSANGNTNFRLSATEESQINGKNAQTTILAFTNAAGLESTARVTTVGDGAVFYVINYVAVDPEYRRNEVTVNAIFNSFTVMT